MGAGLLLLGHTFQVELRVRVLHCNQVALPTGVCVIKLYRLYTHPDDEIRFRHHYFSEHLPLLRATPGLLHASVSSVLGTPLGGAPFYLVVELQFDDRAALEIALQSPEYRAAERVMWFARGIVTDLFAEETAGD